jgi:hypothetical protein
MKDCWTVGGRSEQRTAVNVHICTGHCIVIFNSWDLFVCEICCWQKKSARMHCKCMDDVNCAIICFVMVWTRVSKQVCSNYSSVTEDSSLLGCYAVSQDK